LFKSCFEPEGTEPLGRAYSDFPFRKVVSFQTMVRKALTVQQKLSRTTSFDRVIEVSLPSNRHLRTHLQGCGIAACLHILGFVPSRENYSAWAQRSIV
jgi:hypothetical protein